MELTGRLGKITNRTVAHAFVQYGRIVSVVLFSWTTVGAVQGISASPPTLKSQPVIVVEIHNCTHTTRLEIQEAERQAAAIFAKAGVRISWLNSLPEKHPVRSRINNLPADFSVRIIYAFKVMRLRQISGADALGETTIPSGTVAPLPGGTANVFVDRVDDSSTRWGLFPGEVLGDAIAHELGHLLLGTGHSSQGVMKGDWTSQDLHLGGLGKLQFLPDQAGLLQRAALSLHPNFSPEILAKR